METDNMDTFHAFAKYVTDHKEELTSSLSVGPEPTDQQRLLFFANSSQKIGEISLEFEAFLQLVFTCEPWIMWVRMNREDGINLSFDQIQTKYTGCILSAVRNADTGTLTAKPLLIKKEGNQDQALLIGIRANHESEVTPQMIATFLHEWVHIYLWFGGWLITGGYTDSSRSLTRGGKELEDYVELIAIFTLWRNRRAGYSRIRKLMEKSENKSGATQCAIYEMKSHFQNWKKRLQRDPLHNLHRLIR